MALMGLGINFEKEMGIELARPAEGGGMMDRDIDGLISDIPPKPPAKDLPRIPRPSLSMSRPGTSSSEPPNRPLPPTPMSKAIPPQPTMGLPEAPKRPAPIRPAPLKPQAPLRMNPPTRPGTATSQASGMTDQTRILGSTKRLSWGSMASSRRPIKYGQGKYMHVELVPQPSDDPDDPLNWPMWRKELNFASLLLMVAMTGVMKTMFVSVNARLAEGYDVTYTAAAALTGVPLILSSFTGFLSLVLSRICGKRPLYLVSLLLVFIGAVWNTNVANSYAECMAARIFQGLGWGAFDALVMGSIQDTFFEHQCGLRVAIYSIVAVSTTWGPPLLGGVASEGQAGFSLQFAILSAFFVLAVPAITLGAPETVFDRAYTLAQTPATGASKYKVSLPLAPRRFFSMETFYNYIVKVKPYSYRGSYDLTTLLQAPRAFVAPTTTLLSLVSLFPYCSLWGLSASLSLLFNPAPFALSTRSIGTLMTGPWLLGTGVVAAFALLRWWQTRLTPKAHMAAIAGGSLLAFIGILTFGLHIDAGMAQPDDVAIADDGGATAALSVPSAPQMFLAGANVNFPAISFMLGMLAAGTYALDATVRPLIRASTMFTSSNLGVALRNTTDMGAGVTCWRTLFAGILFIAVPNAVMASGDGLRALCIAFAIAQMVIGALVGTVWWLWGEDIRRWDGRVMRLVDLDMLKSSGSFFDTD